MSDDKEIELERKIDRILSILENDSAIGKDGLVTRVDTLEKDQDKMKSQLKGFVITFSAIGTAWTAFWKYGSKLT